MICPTKILGCVVADANRRGLFVIHMGLGLTTNPFPLHPGCLTGTTGMPSKV